MPSRRAIPLRNTRSQASLCYGTLEKQVLMQTHDSAAAAAVAVTVATAVAVAVEARPCERGR